jgi:hypothetical protein
VVIIQQATNSFSSLSSARKQRVEPAKVRDVRWNREYDALCLRASRPIDLSPGNISGVLRAWRMRGSRRIWRSSDALAKLDRPWIGSLHSGRKSCWRESLHHRILRKYRTTDVEDLPAQLILPVLEWRRNYRAYWLRPETLT